MLSFADRLLEASEAAQSLVCVGLDVNPALMPVPGVADFNRAIVDATADLVCAYKPNIAFYEALGIPGLRALEATVAHIRDAAPDSVIIIDAKRGDIGNTVEAYATAMFDVWGVDAVTVNPWGGLDTLEPWLDRPDRGVFVWCRGSNPGASDLQDLVVDGNEPVYMRLARGLSELPKRGNLGMVVGATAPEQLAEVRRVCPDMPILIPGVGAQGGDLESSVRNGVNASREDGDHQLRPGDHLCVVGPRLRRGSEEGREENCGMASTKRWTRWDRDGVGREYDRPAPGRGSEAGGYCKAEKGAPVRRF